MAKEKMVLFRTAIGGFNRGDVNNYIEKLNAEFSERERIAKKKLDAAECARRLIEVRKPLVVMHVRPDGDTVGSGNAESAHPRGYKSETAPRTSPKNMGEE